MRVAIVGASSGLGAAIAIHHYRHGHYVTAVARRVERLDQLAGVVGGIGHPTRADDATVPTASRWTSIKADVTSDSDQDRLSTQLCDAERIYLVAGINADPRATFETNVLSLAWLAHAIDRDGLQVVVISSLAAVVAFPDLAAYSASKAALEHWMACHRATARAAVLVIRPGQFESDFHSGPRPLDIEQLPLSRATEVAKLADRHRDGLRTIGGWRDRLAAACARVVGPDRARRVL